MKFTCPSDERKSVMVNSGDVVGIDKNGIVLRPDQKYHFRIAGISKNQVAQIFEEWLRSASAGAATQ